MAILWRTSGWVNEEGRTHKKPEPGTDADESLKTLYAACEMVERKIAANILLHRFLMKKLGIDRGSLPAITKLNL